MYSIFNVAVDSELALPELPGIDQQNEMRVYRFSVDSKDGLVAELAGIDWFHDWVDPHGNITIRAGRNKRQYWLRFPGLVDFSVDLAARCITALPADVTDMTTLRHLLLDQVMPRVLGQEGALILHAGAVMLDSGKTLAFAGRTGYGKSTIVSYFERNGARLITDDCLMVVPNQNVANVVPNYAGVRLFADSIDAIYGTSQSLAEVAQYTSKRRVTIPVEDTMLELEHTTLDVLFLLGDPVECESDRVELQPASGANTFLKLVEQSFLLDVTDTTMIAKLFREAGAFLGGKLRCYDLSYPRDHERLEELRLAIEAVL